MDPIESDKIKYALLVTDPGSENCTETVRRLREKGIKFEMQGVFPREKKSITLSIAGLGFPALSISALKLPVLILDLLEKDDGKDILVLEGKSVIINRLALRN